MRWPELPSQVPVPALPDARAQHGGQLSVHRPKCPVSGGSRNTLWGCSGRSLLDVNPHFANPNHSVVAGQCTCPGELLLIDGKCLCPAGLKPSRDDPTTCECIDKRATKYNDQCVCDGGFQYIGGICQCGAGLKPLEDGDYIGVGRRLGEEGSGPDGDHDGHGSKCG